MNYNFKIYDEIFLILNSIYGYSLEILLNFTNYKLCKNFYKDKGWVGKFIEYFLLNKFTNTNSCDSLLLNLEIKTLSIDLFNNINNDTFLMSYKLVNFFKLINKDSILIKKIQKILWIPIIGNNNIKFFKRVIGKCFLSILNNKDILIILNQLNNINNIILHEFYNIKVSIIYTYFLKFQFLNKKKNINKCYIKIYFRKSFLKKIINKNLYFF